MHYNKSLFAIIIGSIMFFSGCIVKNNSKNINVQDNLPQNKYVTIKGIANETKDGFYIGEHVLEHSEIQKYDTDYILSTYRGKRLEIIGKEKEVEIPCETSSGEITQCRQGKYKVIYDIQSIKVIEQ